MAKDYDPGDKIRRWKVNLEKPTAALKQIGAMMKAESQRAFKLQRFGRDEWPARAPINVYGIISDFAAGKKSPPQRRFHDRPVLKDTGRLKKSLDFWVHRDFVLVGTNVVDERGRRYGDTLHGGGPIESEEITPSVRRLLWMWLKGRGKKYKLDLGWLLNKKFKGETLKGEVEPRPFVGITKRTLVDARKIVGTRIMEVD